MRRSILAASALIWLWGCGEAADEPRANTAANTTAEPAKKRPTYCFFKDADTKGWTASQDAGGTITVKGQAHIGDRRYMAALGDPEIEGSTATLWLTMAPNTTGFGSPGDWWQVSATVPDAAQVDKAIVLCGKKQVAELPLKKR